MLPANGQGMTPKEYTDKIVKGIKELWSTLCISYDNFIRTTDDYHVKTVQKIFKQLYDQGDIYKSSYEGWYCTPCESFFTEHQLVDGKCPDCGRDVELLKEESYFFVFPNIRTESSNTWKKTLNSCSPTHVRTK